MTERVSPSASEDYDSDKILAANKRILARQFPKRLVIVESPYAGDVEANKSYARAAVRDCLLRGESPIASHLLYTQSGILDDTILSERELGIAAGLAWRRVADASVIYEDLGVSPGMLKGIEAAKQIGLTVERRRLKAKP